MFVLERKLAAYDGIIYFFISRYCLCKVENKRKTLEPLGAVKGLAHILKGFYCTKVSV